MSESDTTIERGSASHVPAIGRIHIAAFESNLTSRLGSEFLTGYYTSLTESPDSELLVAQTSSDEVAGFICGSHQSASFYSTLRRDPKIILPVLAAFVRDAGLRKAIFFRARSVLLERQVNPTEDLADCSEILSLAVAPVQHGRGVGRRLVESYLDSAFENQSVRGAYITTDADDERAVGFYSSCGFTQLRSFTQKPHRPMVICFISNPSFSPSGLE